MISLQNLSKWLEILLINKSEALCALPPRRRPVRGFCRDQVDRARLAERARRGARQLRALRGGSDRRRGRVARQSRAQSQQLTAESILEVCKKTSYLKPISCQTSWLTQRSQVNIGEHISETLRLLSAGVSK